MLRFLLPEGLNHQSSKSICSWNWKESGVGVGWLGFVSWFGSGNYYTDKKKKKKDITIMYIAIYNIMYKSIIYKIQKPCSYVMMSLCTNADAVV